MALLLDLGVLETLSAGFGGGGQLLRYGPEKVRDFLLWKQIIFYHQILKCLTKISVHWNGLVVIAFEIF